MANEFDLDSFLNQREAAEAGSLPTVQAAAIKAVDTVNVKAGEKVYDLEAIAAEKTRSIQESLGGKLGLDPQGILGETVNTLASGVSGLTRTVGQTINLPINLAAMVSTGSVDEASVQAYNRKLAGKSIEGDEALLSAVPFDMDGNSQTVEQRLRSSAGLRDVATKVADTVDTSGLVDKARRNELSDDLRNSTTDAAAMLSQSAEQFGRGDILDSLLSAASGAVKAAPGIASTLVQNPGAVGEFVAENTPQIAAYAASPVLGAATNAGYGAEQYREGMDEYAKANGGQLPDEATRLKMGLASAGAALLENVGDAAVVKGMLGEGGGAIRRALTTANKEGLTEAGQAPLENIAHNKETSAEDLIENYALGFAVGGSFAGGGAIAGAGSERLAAREEGRAEAATAQATVEAAKQTGDINELVNPESESYNPAGAINVLHSQILSDEATPEMKAEALRQADDIQVTLAEQVQNMEANESLQEPERIAQFREFRDMYQARLEDKTSEDPEKDQLRVAKLSEILEEADAREADPERAQVAAAQLEEQKAQLSKVQEANKQFITDSQPKPEQVSGLMEQVRQSTVEEAQPAAQQVMTLTMANPDAIDLKQARALANSETSGLMPEQRQALRDFTEAQTALNAVDSNKARTDIMLGGNGFRGLTQYRNDVRVALSTGNTEVATQRVEQLESFAAGQQSKAEAIATTYQQIKGTNGVAYIAPNEAGVWMPVDSATGRELKQGTKLKIDGTSFKLRDRVAQEAIALTKAASSLRNVIAAGVVQQANAPVVQDSGVGEGITPFETQTNEQIQVPATELAAAPATVVDPVTALADPAMAEVATADQAVEAPVTGELLALRNAGEVRGQPVAPEQFMTANLAAAYLTQNPGKEGAKSKRPLVSTPNFLTALARKEVGLQDFVDSPVTPKQWGGFRSFYNLMTKGGLGTSIAKSFVAKKDPKYNYTDPVQYLLSNGVAEQNLVTAIGFAAYDWTLGSQDLLFNEESAMNRIVGQSKDNFVPRELRDLLQTAGTMRAPVMNSLGRTAFQALGFKVLPNATREFQSKMEAALGVRVLQSLIANGLAEEHKISNAELDPFRKKSVTDKGFTTFVRPTTVTDEGIRKLTPKALELKKEAMGTQSFMSKVFGVEYGSAEPTFEHVPFTQKTYQRTSQKVAKVLRKALEKRDSIPFFVREDMHSVWNLFDMQGKRALVGMVDTETTPIHGALMRSQEAKNGGLQLQIENMDNYFDALLDISDKGLKQPLYFQSAAWSNQRIGLVQNVFNMQSSKLHRFMAAPKSWNETLKAGDQKGLVNFQLRVLEAFGVKTEKKNLQRTLAGYDALVSKPEIQAGIQELKKVLTNPDYEGSDFNQAVVVAAVRAGGENMHTMSGLVALTHQSIAQDQGAESFDYNLPSEVDGVNNGPMLSMMLLGTLSKKLMQMGGFFTNEYNFEQFSDYHNEPGNLDAYEFNSKETTDNLKDDPRLAHIFTISGNFTTDTGDVTKAGRDSIKKPLTAMVFGSVPRNAVDGMADVFIQNMYKAIQKFGNSEVSEPGKPSRTQLITAINGLMKSKGNHIPLSSSYDSLMDKNVLSKRQLADIKDNFYQTLGAPTEDALNSNYAPFIARREVINDAADLSSDIYTTVLKVKLDAALKTANLARGKNEVALTDLTQEQYAAVVESVKGIRPLVHTAMSKVSKQLDAGMLLIKEAQAVGESRAYGVEVNQADGPSIALQGLETIIQGPGVGTTVKLTHATDSFISQLSTPDLESVNVHDAKLGSTQEAGDIGQSMNQQTFEALLEYSIPTEVAAMLERSITGLNEQITDPEVGEEILAAIRKIAPNGKIQKTLAAIRNVATQADTAKLESLADMTFIGQYATEFGSYAVTDADRSRVEKKQAELATRFDNEVDQIAEMLDTSLVANTVRTPKKETPVSNSSFETVAPATTLNVLDSLPSTPEIDQVKAAMEQGMVFKDAKQVLDPVDAAVVSQQVNDRTGLQRSVFGKLGTPVVNSDPALVDMLVNAPKLTTKDLANRLAERSTDPFNKKLLNALTRLTREMPVVLVTPDTQASEVYGSDVTKARGWYSVSPSGFEALYVKSPQFVESGITEEMLTHELLHTVTGRIIQNELDAAAKSKGYTSEAYRLVQNLEAIRKAADVFIQSNGAMSAQYANAVSNVHELVSWGMSNQGFQEQVLAKITAPQDTRGNSLLNGLQKFIETLTRLVFRGRAQEEMNGMGMLIANTSGLFAAAKQQMDARNGMTLKMEDAMSTVSGMSTREVFDALGQGKHTSASHVAKMESILDGIVDRIYGPMGAFKDEVARGQAMTTEDAFLKALDTNQLPFASKALGSDFVFSKQEAFVLEQVEATVASSLESGDGLFIRNQLESLWNQARSKLSPKSFHPDWANATLDEKKVATAKYHFLFKVQSEVGDKNSYLARFAALAMANEEVSDALSFRAGEEQVDTAGMGIGTRVLETFNRLTAKLGNMYAKTNPSDIASTRLYGLVDRLVDIEAKRKGQMASTKVNRIDQAEMYVNALSNKAREGINKVSESPFFTKSRSPYVRAAGGIVGTVTGERVDTLLNGFTQMRDQNYSGKKYGVLMGMLAEARGITDTNAAAYELFVPQKLDEGLRKNTIENTANDTVAAFKDGGQYLTQPFKDSLTRAGLRTNMQALHNVIGFDALKEVLEDTAKMNVLKNQLEDQVLSYKQGSTYLTLTKALAHNRVVGGSKVRHLLMSTRNIARLAGLNESLQVADQATVVQPLLDQLQAIYGWEYSPSTARKDFKEVLRTEAARDAKDGNGLEFMFKLHRGIQEQALRDNFAGTEALAISGYTSEITDSKIELIHVMAKDRAYYEKRGYQFAGDVQKDALAGTVTGEIQMTRRGSGQVGLVSGAMSTTGMHMKGTRMDGRYYDVLASQPSYTDDAITISKAIAPGVKAMMQIDGKTFDPRMVKETFVAPLLNPNEEVVGFRHMMTEQNRDSLLDRDNSFDQVLGTMAGETIDKTNSVKQNMDVVRAMYDQYKADYTSRPSSFVRVGLASTDPSLVEMYRLLPEATKMEVKRLFGTENMMIPADQLTLVLGYRKLSLTTPFNMAAEERNALQNAYVSVFESIFGEKAALQLGKAEDVIQEMVKMTKDILVVKNIFTLVGNILSNNTVLAAYGVGPIQGLKDMVVAYRAAVDYRKDARRLMTLQRALEIGYLPGGDKKVRDEIAVLQHRLDNNVIKELVDAGMMPTIVEDVEVNDDRYSYKSRLGTRFEKIGNAVPKPVSWVWKNALYLTHDSAAYKFLSQTTQLSDLTARYALHKQLTTRKQDPLSNADSLRRVSDAFVNYDIPSHPTVQFLNDMGAVMFTKYYFRIQKVLFTLMKERPARLMAMVVMHKMFPGMQSILDSSFVNKLGNNPLQNGPFGYLPSLKELPAFKGLMSYF